MISLNFSILSTWQLTRKAVDNFPRIKEGDEKVASVLKSVPQGLKPLLFFVSYGTSEAGPLNKTGIFSVLYNLLSI